MQERRATIRVSYPCRAHYCPSNDLLPRDGHLVNISERGAGLLTRETHRTGERITVSFALPGEDEPVTATGVVRWANPSGRQNRWQPHGLEWLPLEETARHRLSAFVNDRAKASPGQRVPTLARARATGVSVEWIVIRIGFVFGALLCVLLGFWVMALQKQHRELTTAVQEGHATISHLEMQSAGRQRQLEQAQAGLATTTEEVLRLDQETRQLSTRVQQLGQGMEQAQRSYEQVTQEREGLMQRVLDLEQERMLLQHKLSSIPGLRRAIRDAIRTRRQVEHAQRRRLLEARRAESRAQLAAGNRGYVIRDGRSTVDRSTVWIRVHDPEPPLAAPDSSQ